MKTACFKIHPRTRDGNKMRPGSAVPSMHWSYMLTDSLKAFGDVTGFRVVWRDNIPMLEMTREVLDNPGVLEHLMRWCRLNDMEISYVKEECEQCEGHPECLGNEQFIKDHLP